MIQEFNNYTIFKEKNSNAVKEVFHLGITQPLKKNIYYSFTYNNKEFLAQLNIMLEEFYTKYNGEIKIKEEI